MPTVNRRTDLDRRGLRQSGFLIRLYSTVASVAAVSLSCPESHASSDQCERNPQGFSPDSRSTELLHDIYQ